MALLEAQWLGLPAVVGNNGGVSDILNDQVTGFLAAPGDLPDFTAKLTTLIEDMAAGSKCELPPHKLPGVSILLK